MESHQPNRLIAVNSAPPIAAGEWAQGAIQRVDTLGREIAILLSTGLEVLYVPPDCPIYLHGERIKLRLIQPRDQARVTFDRSPEMLVAKLLEIEKRLGAHDDAIAQLFSALRQLLAEPKPSPNKEREIGFHMHEDGLDQTPLVPPHRKTVRYR